MKKMSAVILFLFTISNISAQSIRKYTTNYNGWYMYFGTHQLTDKLSWHTELQWRRYNWITDAQQLLLRTGINYHLSNQAVVTLGYCFVETYPYGAYPAKVQFPENRTWQQVQLKNNIGRFEIINRFRQEQRWMNIPVLKDSVYKPGSAVYQNRFRVLNRFSLPINAKTISDKTLYITAYDELMISFGKNVGMNILDQNRAYLALGYKIPKAGRLELGYMNQHIIKSDGIKAENNHTIQVALFSNTDLIKRKKPQPVN